MRLPPWLTLKWLEEAMSWAILVFMLGLVVLLVWSRYTGWRPK
jgi:hypothetical protein